MRLIFIITAVFFIRNSVAQQIDIVDFKKIQAELSFDVPQKMVFGKIVTKFDILKPVDSIYLDAKKIILTSSIDFVEPNLNGPSSITSNLYEEKLWLVYPFEKGESYSVTFEYKAQPQKALYFVTDQIWTQGQGKYTSNWLPSLDDVNDKIEFDLSITHNKGYEVVANGKLKDKRVGDSLVTWRYDMIKPMPSYLVALANGDYSKDELKSESGVPIELYYYPEDSLKAEPTYRHTKTMFDFLETEIDVPFPWQNYKQVPVHDFLYAGMENTSLTIFSDSYVVDSIGYNDKNYITVNAHELTHQWFGNYVTATSGEHHWLQEGFATYYALLAEGHLFGEDHYYWQLFQNAQELIAQEEAGGSTSLLNPKSSSTTFYKKGAWALHQLRELIGDEAFRRSVKSYLEQHAYGNVNSNDFISEVEKISNFDLKEFRTKWLDNVELPEAEIVQSLKQSQFMQDYFNINCAEYSVGCQDYFRLNVSDKAKIKVIAQIPNQINASAFNNSLEVRQAISKYVQTIPPSLKTEYESLLNDQSYITIENALYNLWSNFPTDRAKYLQKTKNVIGFNDYNVRLLWLALHLNTIEYQPDWKQDVLIELKSYSEPKEHFELRMNAFNYIKLLDAWDDSTLASLVEASQHKVWQFRKYAKALISELEKDQEKAEIISELKKSKS